MNAGLQKLVDSGFMTVEHGEYIEKAVQEKDTIIVSGHKGWGILPLLATIGALAKEHHPVKQVKGFECLAEESGYLLIVSPKEENFEKLVTDAFSNKAVATITLKDPDHPYSIMKVLKDVYKTNADTSRVYQVIECAKINDEKKLSKITRMTIGEGGKINKIDL